MKAGISFCYVLARKLFPSKFSITAPPAHIAYEKRKKCLPGFGNSDGQLSTRRTRTKRTADCKFSVTVRFIEKGQNIGNSKTKAECSGWYICALNNVHKGCCEINSVKLNDA
eukprot:Pgem_evm1s6644